MMNRKHKIFIYIAAVFAAAFFIAGTILAMGNEFANIPGEGTQYEVFQGTSPVALAKGRAYHTRSRAYAEGGAYHVVNEYGYSEY